MKLNNRTRPTLPKTLLIIGLSIFLLALLFRQFLPTEPTLTTEVIVLDTETTSSLTYSRSKNIKHFHCDVFVQEKDVEKTTKFRFTAETKTDSKTYCDDLVKGKQYLFTHYEKENAAYGIATDYKIIEKP